MRRIVGLFQLINWPIFLAIILLIALSVGLILNNLGVLPQSILAYWPLALLILSALWTVLALIRRRVRSLLGSTALLGLSIALFLITTGNIIASGSTLLGIMLISVGAGLLLRGLLLRGQPI